MCEAFHIPRTIPHAIWPRSETMVHVPTPAFPSPLCFVFPRDFGPHSQRRLAHVPIATLPQVPRAPLTPGRPAPPSHPRGPGPRLRARPLDRRAGPRATHVPDATVVHVPSSALSGVSHFTPPSARSQRPPGSRSRRHFPRCSRRRFAPAVQRVPSPLQRRPQPLLRRVDCDQMRDIAVGNITLGYLVQHARDVPHVSSVVSWFALRIRGNSSMQTVSSSSSRTSPALVPARRARQRVRGCLGQRGQGRSEPDPKVCWPVPERAISRPQGSRRWRRRWGPKRTVGFIGGRSAKQTHTGLRRDAPGRPGCADCVEKVGIPSSIADFVKEIIQLA